MSASVLYRLASVLLVLFAAGHTLGFRATDPRWGVDALLASMRSTHIEIQGFDRTYWDFYTANGFSVGVFLLFAAALAWQLGGLPAAARARLRGIAWAFSLCFAAIAVLSCCYLFLLPIAFSAMVAVCLMAAAWRSSE
jgi:hypothetical protein